MVHTDGRPTIANGAGDDLRCNLTPVDFRLQDEGGSLTILHPCNDAARGWIDDNLYAVDGPPQWWGGGVVVEWRYLDGILAGIVGDGFKLGT